MTEEEKNYFHLILPKNRQGKDLVFHSLEETTTYPFYD